MKRVSLAIIKNADGKFLLQHKDKDAPNFPNTWCLFGGGVEPGETPRAAIIRELQEELGVRIDNVKLLAVAPDERAELTRYYYRIKLDEPIAVLKSQLTEGDDVQYFALSQLRKLNVNPAHHQALVEQG